MTLPPAHQATAVHCQCCPPKRVCVVLNVQGSDLWVHPLPWNFLRGMWLWPAISMCVLYSESDLWAHPSSSCSFSCQLWSRRCRATNETTIQPPVCVCCAYYQTQAGKGSNLWWVTLQRPLLTFGFSKWSTCTCGFIKYQLNQSSKNWQIILETAVALF